MNLIEKYTKGKNGNWYGELFDTDGGLIEIVNQSPPFSTKKEAEDAAFSWAINNNHEIIKEIT